ncbi:MAG TPA: rhodanese-like domain-containing protein [Methylophilaceae bacterium]|nr:rhodanese-like domain-containing protein [Methylophilaceae bacterium]
MDFILENVLLVGLAVVSGLMLAWPMLSRMSGTSSNLGPADAVLLINRENALVLDVREDAEYAAGHITDARHIPLTQLESRVGELGKFKDKPVLVNCQAGMRSAKACGILKKHGFSKVWNLQGGLNAWQQAKLPVVK